jgi:hypothetical protein
VADDLVIRISANIKNFQDNLDKAQQKTETLGDTLESVAKASAVAFAALTAEVVLSVKAYAESEKATRDLTVALQNQGLYSEKLASGYKKQADELSRKTGIDDDAITAGQAMLQTMIGQVEITPQLTAAIVDLSERTGSLDTAFELVGKGINGQTKGLKALGIEIDTNLPKQQRMSSIVSVLTQRFGGQAEAANQGLGSIRGLTTAFGNLQEAIGQKFAPLITAATQGLTKFLQYVENHDEFVSLAAAVVAGGAAIAGIVTVVATAGAALLSFNAVAGVLGVTLTAVLGPVGLLIAAVAALAAGVGYYITKTKDAEETTDGLQQSVERTRASLERMKKAVPEPIRTIVEKKAIEAEEAKLAALEDRLRSLQSASRTPAAQDQQKSDAADKAELERQKYEARKLALVRAEQELLILEAQNSSKRQIELKREEIATLKQLEDEKYKAVEGDLEKNLARVRELETQAASEDVERRQVIRDELLAENEAFQELTAQQKRVFADRELAQIQEQVLTEQSAKRMAADNELKLQVENHQRLLLDRQKFGVAYAAINETMHSEVYKGTKSAFGELAVLQTSWSKEQKAIGKAAALANIVIKTAESAMNIYAGFSTIPIVGPILGAAGAAAAIAFGAQQASAVVAAADGGLITGGMAGRDSVPAVLMPGEIVAPKSNFEEVIGSVRAQREAQRLQDTSQGGAFGSGGGSAEVVLSLRDNLVEFIEAKIVERQRIGISLIPQGVS